MVDQRLGVNERILITYSYLSAYTVAADLDWFNCFTCSRGLFRSMMHDMSSSGTTTHAIQARRVRETAAMKTSVMLYGHSLDPSALACVEAL